MSEMWQRRDFVGRVARQLLSPPMVAKSFVKSHGISELTEEQLGPRLNLRLLGTYQTFGTIVLSFLFGQLLVGVPSLGFLFLIMITIGYIFIMSFINNNHTMWRQTSFLLKFGFFFAEMTCGLILFSKCSIIALAYSGWAERSQFACKLEEQNSTNNTLSYHGTVSCDTHRFSCPDS